MADNIIFINGQEVKLIPLGKCACGCGSDTKIATENRYDRGCSKGRPMKFIKNHHTRGQLNYKWRNGKKSINNGKYETIKCENHYHADNRGYVREHILVAEKALGKPLPHKAVIHHIDGDGLNNQNHNLVICQNNKYHLLIEQRTRAYKECQHANWRKCPYCKEYDDPHNMINTSNGRQFYHPKCRNNYKRNLYKKKKESSLTHFS